MAEGLCVCLPSLPELLILFLRFVQVRIYDLDYDFGTKKTQKCASHKWMNWNRSPPMLKIDKVPTEYNTVVCI